jgi:hypothetical protein
MAKAELLETQSPGDATFPSAGKTSETGVVFCDGDGTLADATFGTWSDAQRGHSRR